MRLLRHVCKQQHVEIVKERNIMKNHYPRLATKVLWVLIFFIAAACNSGINEVSGIQVSKPDQANTILGTIEDFPLPNCGGNRELAQTLGTQASVKKTVTISATATVQGNLEKIFLSAETKAKLEAVISAAYSDTLQSESSRLDNIELRQRLQVMWFIDFNGWSRNIRPLYPTCRETRLMM